MQIRVVDSDDDDEEDIVLERIIRDTSFASTMFSGCGKPCARIVDSRATTGRPDEMASLTSGRTRNNREDVVLEVVLLLRLQVDVVIAVVGVDITLLIIVVEGQVVENASLRLMKDNSRLIIILS